MIRDNMGHPLCSYSGTMLVSESNEAEIYVMLVGCSRLKSLGGHNAIIEGDSFFAIQWGSRKAFVLRDWQTG